MLEEAINGAKEETSSLDFIRVSHHPYIHGLPTTVAIDNGIYEANGLKPEVTMYGGGAAQNEAIASDAWDVGTTGLAGAVVGCIGYDMKVIGATVYDGKTIDVLRVTFHDYDIEEGLTFIHKAKEKGYKVFSKGIPRLLKYSVAFLPTGSTTAF